MSLEPNEVDNVSRDTGQTMLYERYGQAIFGYLRLHAHSLEDAEDLLLEVFLAALERDNLSALPPGGQLAWLRRVAHNKLLNLYRQASRHPHVVLDSVVDTMLEADGPERQALARVHERLAHSSQPLPLLDAVRIDDLARARQRVTPAAPPTRISRIRRRWLTRLGAFAAAMLVIVLVGSLALTFSLIHHTSVGSPPGNDIHLVLEPVKGSHPSRANMQAASEILSQRFSNFGLSGASTNVGTTNGHLAIWVDLPHFGGNEQQTIATLVQTGHLEFWCTGPLPVPLNTTFEPARYAQYNPGGRPRFTGRDLDPNSLSVSHDQAGPPQIDFEMQGSSIDAFGSFTAHNIGEYLTITFDRKVIESAVIESAITGPAVITSNFTQQQANAVVADLKAGSLPVALTAVAG